MQIVVLLRCAHANLRIYFLLLVSFSLDRWAWFIVLNYCCDFAHFCGIIIDVEEGSTINRRHSLEQYQLQLEVLNSSEFVGHKTMFAMSLNLKLFSFVDAYASP